MAIVVGTDTYVSVADANTYFKLAIHAAAWDNASSGDKEKSLATATRQLDRQDWDGEKYEDAPTQALDFPRSGLIDSEDNAVDEAVVPQEIIDATCELGLALLNNNQLQDQSTTGSNIKSLKAGSAEIEYIRATSGSRFPTIVDELIGLWLTAGSGSATALAGPFVSGADNESLASDTFGLNRGL
ncbi:MAG: DnaT-like ssDNA-binding protein [Candidatus Thorarchaeota archaeon]